MILTRYLLIATFLMLMGVPSGILTAADDADVVYELRTYTTAEGKLPALHARFRDHTMKLFEKHGMKNVIYFTPADKPNTLVYLLQHKSRAAAAASWDGFRKDPDWQKAFKASRRNGPLVIKVQSQFLKTTEYSPGD